MHSKFQALFYADNVRFLYWLEFIFCPDVQRRQTCTFICNNSLNVRCVYINEFWCLKCLQWGHVLLRLFLSCWFPSSSCCCSAILRWPWLLLVRRRLLPSLVALPHWAAGFHKAWVTLGWQVCVHYGWRKKNKKKTGSIWQPVKARKRSWGWIFVNDAEKRSSERKQRKQQRACSLSLFLTYRRCKAHTHKLRHVCVDVLHAHTHTHTFFG